MVLVENSVLLLIMFLTSSNMFLNLGWIFFKIFKEQEYVRDQFSFFSYSKIIPPDSLALRRPDNLENRQIRMWLFTSQKNSQMASCKYRALYLSICLQIISYLTKRLWGQKKLELNCWETLPIGDQSKMRKIKHLWNQHMKQKTWFTLNACTYFMHAFTSNAYKHTHTYSIDTYMYKLSVCIHRLIDTHIYIYRKRQL